MLPLMKEMSTGLYIMLDNDTNETKAGSVLELMNTRKKYLAVEYDNILHHGDRDDSSLACYSTSVTYRAAMWDLRRYFEVRGLYTDSMEFEVGYLNQDIIHRYTILLELYQMMERRIINKEHLHLASGNHFFYMYTTMLEQSKAIIHLCNMLHEIENKYKSAKKGVGIFHDETHFAMGPSAVDKTAVNDNHQAYERWLQMKRREERKRAKERKKYWKQLQKFGLTTKRKPTTRKGSWPLQYGWSIENW
ncbi:uncharacterized protein LOC124542349 [Vanessa cardui]|uniref:uncharacterized protein LOC124542349 n=1 Tax=Vanessa cardui TaxID=171605 RepID=UPI001F1471E1|nr:uncharacterized protein LOC124542349 [Vanessa cardui]